MSTDAVAEAVYRLATDFPNLYAAVMPAFEHNARKAVAKHGMEALHCRRLSLLTTLAASENAFGWGESYLNILATLDAQVAALSQTTGAPPVFHRLSECGRGTMLSSISELAFASHLTGIGARIAFECKYTLREGNATHCRDADIVATWPWGSVAFEVYSPVKSIDAPAGFIDPQPRGLADTVARKIAHKFGAKGATHEGLPAGTLKVLALDVAYNDLGFLGIHSALGKVKDELLDVDLGAADAVLVFAHVQSTKGHPVHTHGILHASLNCAPLFRAFDLSEGM